MFKPVNVKDPAYYQKEEVKQSKSKKGRVDKETYYGENGFNVGIWEGEGAMRLGFHGQPIWEGELAKLQAGFHPKTGKKLFTPQDSNYEFVDCTISAVKDFTIAKLMDTGLDYDEFFERAFQRTLTKMQSKSIHDAKPKNRLGEGELGLIVATYHHSTSRPTAIRPDPQEHRHCLVFKKGITKNGKARSIHNRFLYDNQKLFGVTFRAELANCLREVGYEIVAHKEKEPDDNPNGRTVYTNAFAIKGITKEMRDSFSNRSVEIEEAAKRSGNTSSINKAWIAQNKKRGKDIWDQDTLTELWREDANSLGINKEHLDSLKTFSQHTQMKSIKSDQRLIMNSYVKHWKTKERILYEKNVLLKLVEEEQITGINGELRFKELVKEGLIKRVKGYVYEPTFELEDVKKFDRAIKNRYTIDSKEFIQKFNENFSNGKFTKLINKIFNGEKMTPKVKPENTTVSPKKELDRRPVDTNTQPTTKPLYMVGTGKTVSEMKVSIVDLEAKATRSDLSVEDRFKIKLEIERLQKNIAGEVYKEYMAEKNKPDPKSKFKL